ncbi:hypothetical protein Hanom_Chr15g01341971 [Helianthus anomalus]
MSSATVTGSWYSRTVPSGSMSLLEPRDVWFPIAMSSVSEVRVKKLLMKHKHK